MTLTWNMKELGTEVFYPFGKPMTLTADDDDTPPYGRGLQSGPNGMSFHLKPGNWNAGIHKRAKRFNEVGLPEGHPKQGTHGRLDHLRIEAVHSIRTGKDSSNAEPVGRPDDGTEIPGV